MAKLDFCPHCHKELPNVEETKIIIRGAPKFKWWVTPVNLLILCLMLVMLDAGTSILSDVKFGWGLWASAGIFLFYLATLLFTYRPEDAWVVVPIFFTLLSAYLAVLDIASGNSSSLPFNLTWSFYPIVIIMVLFAILPTITYIGRDVKKPVEVLKEIIEVEEQ